MFNIFFHNNNGNKHKSKNNIIDELHVSLLASPLFISRLRQERLRSERSGLPLSLATINLKSLFNALSTGTGTSPQQIFQQLENTLNAITRECDVKGWLEDEKIGIIAPDTGESGIHALAKRVAKDIAIQLSLNGNSYEDDLMQHFGVCCISSDQPHTQKSKRSNSVRPPTQRGYNLQYFSANPVIPQGLSLSSSSVNAAALPTMTWPFDLEIIAQAQMHETQLALKRMIDITISMAAIVLFAPIMLIIAALIKLTSPGPVLFCQQRLGLMGKPFIFLKFRSMKVDCDSSLHRKYVENLIKGDCDATNQRSSEKPIFKITNDPRITVLGRFLRKTSLDELPQLFNVLKGDMSLVGPRPHPVYECKMYKGWHWRRLLEAKPGITGYWQVHGRSRTTYDEMVRLDLTYIRNWSLSLDLQLLLKTPLAVISTKGAS